MLFLLPGSLRILRILKRYGVPLELHTDQGRNFESQLFQELMRILGIRKDDRSSSSATGVTPSELFCGRDLTLPIDLLRGTPPSYGFSESAEEYVRNLRQKLDKIHQRVRERLESRS
ncbi:hypothetical protein P5V15_004288 [Pogonomyrmex californicus]